MQLVSLRLQNFQSHADTTLDKLSPVTVLVGPNGAGKSATFEGIRTLSRVLTGPVAQAFGPPPFSFQSKTFRGAAKREMGFEAEFAEHGYEDHIRYSILLGYSGREDVDAAPSILKEVVRIGEDVVFDRAAKSIKVTGMSMGDVKPDLSLLAVIRKDRAFRGPRVLGQLARRAGSVVRYRLEPRQLSQPSLEPEWEDTRGPAKMGYEGDNLAAVLYWLSEEHPATLDQIVKDIQPVVPKFKGITFNFIGADRVGFSLIFDDARQAIPAPNASSGTLLLLGLVTLLRSPTQPDIACIEEPETGLTPDAVRLVFRLLWNAAKADGGRPRSQFLFSSHSPFVLVDAWNELEKDRAFIKRVRIGDGKSVIENLQTIIDKGDSGAVLQKDKDGRTTMGLKTAEELMCGRFMPNA